MRWNVAKGTAKDAIRCDSCGNAFCSIAFAETDCSAGSFSRDPGQENCPDRIVISGISQGKASSIQTAFSHAAYVSTCQMGDRQVFWKLGPMSKEDAVVNRRTVNRSGGDARVAFQKEIPEPPRGSSVAAAHPGIDLAKMKFYEVVHVVDADDQNRVFKFSLQGIFRKEQQVLHHIRPVICGLDPEHCACFNIGEGKDGSPLLSWSNLFAFYELPDGSKWAEHGYLYDREDLVRASLPSVISNTLLGKLRRQER